MNMKQLYKRKRILQAMLRAVNGLPESYLHKAELHAKVLRAIMLEKRGEHDEANKLIIELDELTKLRQEELGR